MSEIKCIDPPKRPRSKLVAIGSSGLIYIVDKDSVIKVLPNKPDDYQRQAYDIETRAYRQLGPHPNIAAVRELADEGLILERGECLRRMNQNVDWEGIGLDRKLRWAREAAEGLHYIHQKGIIHADVGCHNLIIDKLGHIKFIDFGGSGIDGEPALVYYESCAYKPGKDPCVETDIFAFGSTLFEIESGKMPFHELENEYKEYELMRKMERLFLDKQYPKLENLALGDVIRGCWDGKYKSMCEVKTDLQCLDPTRVDPWFGWRGSLAMLVISTCYGFAVSRFHH